jgi:hypothetical protein
MRELELDIDGWSLRAQTLVLSSPLVRLALEKKTTKVKEKDYGTVSDNDPDCGTCEERV